MSETPVQKPSLRILAKDCLGTIRAVPYTDKIVIRSGFCLVANNRTHEISEQLSMGSAFTPEAGEDLKQQIFYDPSISMMKSSDDSYQCHENFPLGIPVRALFDEIENALTAGRAMLDITDRSGPEIFQPIVENFKAQLKARLVKQSPSPAP